MNRRYGIFSRRTHTKSLFVAETGPDTDDDTTSEPDNASQQPHDEPQNPIITGPAEEGQLELDIPTNNAASTSTESPAASTDRSGEGARGDRDSADSGIEDPHVEKPKAFPLSEEQLAMMRAGYTGRFSASLSQSTNLIPTGQSGEKQQDISSEGAMQPAAAVPEAAVHENGIQTNTHLQLALLSINIRPILWEISCSGHLRIDGEPPLAEQDLSPVPTPTARTLQSPSRSHSVFATNPNRRSPEVIIIRKRHEAVVPPQRNVEDESVEDMPNDSERDTRRSRKRHAKGARGASTRVSKRKRQA